MKNVFSVLSVHEPTSSQNEEAITDRTMPSTLGGGIRHCGSIIQPPFPVDLLRHVNTCYQCMCPSIGANVAL